jgi:hypothetical protein
MIARNASHLPSVLGGLCHHSPLPVVREQRFEDQIEGMGECWLWFYGLGFVIQMCCSRVQGLGFKVASCFTPLRRIIMEEPPCTDLDYSLMDVAPARRSVEAPGGGEQGRSRVCALRGGDVIHCLSGRWGELRKARPTAGEVYTTQCTFLSK